MDDHRISVAEAAQRLGVSERTVRRRIKAGEIRAASIETPQGHTWHVDPASLPDHPALPPGSLERHPADATRHDGHEEIATRQDPASTRQEEVATRHEEIATRQPSDTPGGMPPGTPVAPELMKTLDMLDEERRKVDDLQAALREATNATAHWQARAVAAEQTIQKLLPAPVDEPEPPARPWWRRMFGL